MWRFQQKSQRPRNDAWQTIRQFSTYYLNNILRMKTSLLSAATSAASDKATWLEWSIQQLWPRTLKCGRMYTKNVPKGVSMEGVHRSTRRALRQWWSEPCGVSPEDLVQMPGSSTNLQVNKNQAKHGAEIGKKIVDKQGQGLFGISNHHAKCWIMNKRNHSWDHRTADQYYCQIQTEYVMSPQYPWETW